MGRQRMSAAALARNTGLAERYLRNRLAARHALNLDDIELVADVLGVNPMALFPADLIATRDVPRPRRPEPTRPPARPARPNGPSRRRP